MNKGTNACSVLVEREEGIWAGSVSWSLFFTAGKVFRWGRIEVYASQPSEFPKAFAITSQNSPLPIVGRDVRFAVHDFPGSASQFAHILVECEVVVERYNNIATIPLADK